MGSSSIKKAQLESEDSWCRTPVLLSWWIHTASQWTSQRLFTLSSAPFCFHQFFPRHVHTKDVSEQFFQARQILSELCKKRSQCKHALDALERVKFWSSFTSALTGIFTPEKGCEFDRSANLFISLMTFKLERWSHRIGIHVSHLCFAYCTLWKFVCRNFVKDSHNFLHTKEISIQVRTVRRMNIRQRDRNYTAGEKGEEKTLNFAHELFQSLFGTKVLCHGKPVVIDFWVARPRCRPMRVVRNFPLAPVYDFQMESIDLVKEKWVGREMNFQLLLLMWNLLLAFQHTGWFVGLPYLVREYKCNFWGQMYWENSGPREGNGSADTGWDGLVVETLFSIRGCFDECATWGGFSGKV